MTTEQLESALQQLQANSREAIIRLWEYKSNGDKYTESALSDLNDGILSYVQVSISEMRVLEAELEDGLND